MLGAFLDLIEIDNGWESAFNAAIGSAANSVVVRDTQIAKQVLQKIRSAGKSGRVIITTNEKKNLEQNAHHYEIMSIFISRN